MDKNNTSEAASAENQQKAKASAQQNSSNKPADPTASAEEETSVEVEVDEESTAANTDGPEVQAQADEKSDTEKLADMQLEVQKLKDQLLRQMAEFDNYRKRTIKEKADLIVSGGQKVLESLLPVIDDLERAQQSVSQSNEIDVVKEGIDLIFAKLTKALTDNGLVRIDTTDAPFDTDFHEAIALVPTDDPAKKNHVIDCVQAGYTLNGKVIRHAKVAVGQ